MNLREVLSIETSKMINTYQYQLHDLENEKSESKLSDLKDDWWQMHHGARWFIHYLCCKVASSCWWQLALHGNKLYQLSGASCQIWKMIDERWLMKDDWWQMHHDARWFIYYLCCEVASSCWWQLALHGNKLYQLSGDNTLNKMKKVKASSQIWKMIDDRCTTAHVDSYITFAARLLPAVDDSWLLNVVAPDSLDHITAFVKF